MAVLRELLPCPRIFLTKEDNGISLLSRSVRSRVRRRLHGDAWCNAAVDSLNKLYGSKRVDSEIHVASSAQLQVGARIRADIASFGTPPCSAAEAFRELCGQRPGSYNTGAAGPAPYQREGLSLPAAGGTCTNVEGLLSGRDLTSWRGWRQHMLRSQSDASQDLQSREGLSSNRLNELDH